METVLLYQIKGTKTAALLKPVLLKLGIRVRIVEPEQYLQSIGFLAGNKAFAESPEQNSLREHDFDLILAFYENLIHEKSGSPVSPEMHFLLEMYCQGSITMTVKWVLTGMDLTPSEFAALLVRAMPEDLKKLFRNLQLLS